MYTRLSILYTNPCYLLLHTIHINQFDYILLLGISHLQFDHNLSYMSHKQPMNLVAYTYYSYQGMLNPCSTTYH